MSTNENGIQQKKIKKMKGKKKIVCVFLFKENVRSIGKVFYYTLYFAHRDKN